MIVMCRDRISLDGVWEFRHLGDADPIAARTITVPGPWQAQFADLRMRAGIGTYRRIIDIAPGWLGEAKRCYIRFGAVFHNTSVWMNGSLAGAHEGGFLPFHFDVTDKLVPGANEIKLRVESPTGDPSEVPDAPFQELLFGKQSWYGPQSGVWQSVFLEQRSPEHVARLRLEPELASGRLRVRIFFSKPLLGDAVIGVTIFDPDGDIAAAIADTAKPGTEETECEIAVPQPRSWSPDDPCLYRAAVALRRSGQQLDAVAEKFGFRSIETRNGRILLNGKPIYLRGALDQDYYPDSICTAPSLDFLRDQFRKAKDLGLNCIRCHIKAPDPRYYEAADEAGLLVWTELPNCGIFTERSRARLEATLRGIVERDFNHPCIVIWTIINENWGTDLVHDAGHRAWLRQTYRWLRTYDPTRLVVDNSPLKPSFHVETDLADYHHYAAFPDNRQSWDQFVAGLAGRAGWLFSPHGDAAQRGDEPLLCSEFGSWGLPKLEDIRNADGSEPWWFETGHDWGEGVMYPHGAANRFTDWSLDRVFGTFAKFAEAAQWQQFRALKYEIETLRRRPEIAGYVITEFTDCHWESNGLLDMRRNPRVFHHDFAAINTGLVIVPAWTRRSYWAGETMRFGVAIANGANSAIENATLRIGLDRSTAIEVPAVAASSVAELGDIEVPLSHGLEPGMHRIQMRLVAGAETIASNFIDIAVHRRTEVNADAGLLWSRSAQRREWLSGRGYRIAAGMEDADLLVETTHDAEAAAFVRGGGRLLLTAEDEMPLSPFFPHWQNVHVRRREGTPWTGDWASSFAWLRRGSAFARMPGGPLIDETFDRVLPAHVISGCNLSDFQGRVHAGLAAGWIHKPAALIVERPYGKGRMVATTLRLFRDAPVADPTATQLLDALIALAFGE